MVSWSFLALVSLTQLLFPSQLSLVAAQEIGNVANSVPAPHGSPAHQLYERLDDFFIALNDQTRTELNKLDFLHLEELGKLNPFWNNDYLLGDPKVVHGNILSMLGIPRERLEEDKKKHGHGMHMEKGTGHGHGSSERHCEPVHEHDGELYMPEGCPESEAENTTATDRAHNFYQEQMAESHTIPPLPMADNRHWHSSNSFQAAPLVPYVTPPSPQSTRPPIGTGLYPALLIPPASASSTGILTG